MITLTNGSVQSGGGVGVPNGSMTLQLNADTTVIASPAIVVSAIPVTFKFDSSGNLLGSCKIWSNAELTPQTQYIVNFFDANGARLTNPILWQFTQSSGATVDIGTMTAVGGNVSYPQPVIQAPTGAQTITGFDLILATANLQLDSTHVVKWNSDTGLSRISAAVLGLGNGTNGDVTGELRLAKLNKITVTQPATGATLTLLDGKTLKCDNTLEFAGTDGTKQTFPASPPTGGVLSYGGPNSQVFKTNGTFTIPTGVTAVKVTLVGGGGAGGGATAANNGSGGGSGGYAIKWLTGLTPGNTIAVTVGGGGAGVSGAGGNNGTASSIASGTQTITTVTANGGTGGSTAASGGAVGGGNGASVSTNGDVNGAGVPGETAWTANASGSGGATFLGGAGNNVGPSTIGASAVANTGSGGSGAGAGATNAGGNGAAGIVVFEWTN